jgi:hypothetical protein
MGLDITYYRKATLAPEEVQQRLAAIEDIGERMEAAENANCRLPWINKHFPGREAGIEPGKAYNVEEADGFRAGSYGGYNRWRRQLAAMVGIDNVDRWWKNPDARPFAELINFADNEGVIGPIVSAKLAKDFADHQEQAEHYAANDLTDDGEWFLRKYGEWREAFETAAQGGYVDFH